VDDIIQISGSNFNSVPLKNTVKFGGFQCNIVTSTPTQITCRMNKTDEPSVNTWLPITLSVDGKGNALVEIRSEYNYSVIFQHRVESVNPITGSDMGGTLLTLRGTGLNIKELKISLGINGWCGIVEQSYNEVKCLTASDRRENYTGEYVKQIIVEDRRYEAELQQTKTNLTFKFDSEITPVITSMTPIKITDPNTRIEFVGKSLGATKEMHTILVGDKIFSVDLFSLLGSGNIKLELTIPALQKGLYQASVLVDGIGYAKVNNSNTYNIALTVEGKVNSIQPNSGSVYGGTKFTVNGFGFIGNQSTVTIHEKQATMTYDRKACTIVNANHTTITFITPRVSPGGSKFISIDKNMFGSRFFFTEETFFTEEKTPNINSLSKNKGVAGDTITLHGQFYSITETDYIIHFGDALCTSITVIDNSTVNCVLGIHSATSNAIVSVNIEGYGNSNNNLIFTYDLQATAPNSLSSGIGGGLLVNITGKGFSDQTAITICDLPCHIIKQSHDNLNCISPELQNFNKESQQINCTMNIAEGGLQYELSGQYVYDQDKTSTITKVVPSRVGTGGGVEITLIGTGFATNVTTVVTIDNVACEVLSVTLTEVKCRTAETDRTAMNAKIVLEFANLDRAVSNETLEVIDVWSSRFTWGYNDPPKKGNFLLTCIFANKRIWLENLTPSHVVALSNYQVII